MLVGRGEGGAVCSAVLRDFVEGGGRWEGGLEFEAVEGGEHGEFELEGVVGWDVEAGVVCAFPDCY